MYQHKKERIADFEQLFFWGERWHTAPVPRSTLNTIQYPLLSKKEIGFAWLKKLWKNKKKKNPQLNLVESCNLGKSGLKNKKLFTKLHITSSVLITHSWITLWLVDSNSLLCMPNAYLIPSYSSLCTKASFISGCGFIISHRIPPKPRQWESCNKGKRPHWGQVTVL